MNHDKRIMDAVESAAAKQATANASLAAMAPAQTYLANWQGAVDDTLNGQTLATLKGSALATGLARVFVRPEYSTDNVRFVVTGNASATSARLPAAGKWFTAAQAATMKLFAAVNANIEVDEV